MLRVDRLEIAYLDNNLRARLSLCADEKAAGLESSSGSRLEAFAHRCPKAKYHAGAQADRYRITWNVPDQTAIRSEAAEISAAGGYTIFLHTRIARNVLIVRWNAGRRGQG